MAYATRSSSTRPKLFLALSCALVLITGAYIYAARRSAPRQQYGAYAVGSVVHPTHRSSLASLRTRSYVAFRSLAPDAGYGALAFVPVDAPSGPRDTTDFACRRLYSSAGVIFCLGQTRASSAAFVLDD